MRYPLVSSMLLLVAAAAAGAPPVPPAVGPVSQTRTVPLRYARPWDLLKVMHWDTSAAVLPVGVRQIRSVSEENALSVEGTPEGAARVQEIVRALDVRPRFVGVRVQFVRATRAEVAAEGINFDLVPMPGQPATATKFYGSASGRIVSQMLQRLTQAHPDAATEADLVTCNNVPASASARAVFPGASGGETRPIGAQAASTVTPRINSDGTITLTLASSVSMDGPGTPLVQGGTILRTVSDRETMVLTGFDMDADTELLLFVTPTLRPSGN